MSRTPTPTEIMSAYITALRDEATFDDYVVRRGPLQALRLGARQAGVILVELAGMDGAEESRGSGNVWTHDWALQVTLAVPDQYDDPDAAETARLTLLEAWLDWQGAIEQRSLATAKTGRIRSLECVLLSWPAETEQIYRAVIARVVYTSYNRRSE